MMTCTSTAPPPSSLWHRRSRSIDNLKPFDLYHSPFALGDNIETMPISFEAKKPSHHRRFGSASSAPGDISRASLRHQIPIALQQICSHQNTSLRKENQQSSTAAVSTAAHPHQEQSLSKKTTIESETKTTKLGCPLSPLSKTKTSKPRPNLPVPDENTIAESERTLRQRLTCCEGTTPKRTPTAESQSHCSDEASHNNNNHSISLTMSPVKSLVQGVVHAVENVQEHHRKAQCRKRISKALLTLRAATEVLEEQKRQKRCDEEEDEDSVTNDDADWRDLAAALFSPLDQHCHVISTSVSEDPTETRDEPDTATTTTVSASIPVEEGLQEEKFPVRILPEPKSMLSCNPRLLSQTMFQQLIDDGVPECLHMNAWERVFSIGRDGDSFLTLLDYCAPYRYTILVVQTTTGHLLGGFVSDSWQEQDGYAERHSYYGTGVSFLFASRPLGQAPSTDTSKPLTIYPWTGSNDFCQICDRDKNMLAMGGSGAFGFILEDDFYKGSTDHCGTFGNPPLTPDADGIFNVASMEVYGLVPYGLLQSYNPPTSESPRSVVDTNPNAVKSIGGF